MVVGIFLSFSIVESSQGQGLLCEWFGVGCPKGISNETLIDLGRQSTNQGFLFLDGDSARIRRVVEFTFSEESIRKKDKVVLFLTEGLLPKGSVVLVNGENMDVASGIDIIATSPTKKVEFLWIIPPTGKDIKINGTINMQPYGFERVGNVPINSGKRSMAIPMLRIQGKVCNDWHWFKRLVFWGCLVFVSIISLYKFFLAPFFLYRRFDLRGLRVELFEDGKAIPLWEHDFRSRIYGARKALIGQKIPRSGWIPLFLKGRMMTAQSSLLPLGLLIEVDRGKRKPLLGKKIQVKYGAGLVNAIYENSKPEERRITLPNSKLPKRLVKIRLR